MIKIKESKLAIREFPIIEIGVPNSVGNIYTPESVKKILEIMEERKHLTGELVDGLSYDEGEYVTKLDHVSHVVDHMFIEDDFLVAVLRFRETRNGKDALKMFEEGIVTPRPTLRGKVDSLTHEIMINDIISVDLIPVTDKVLQKEINWITLK